MADDAFSKASLKHFISGEYLNGASLSILAETSSLQRAAKTFSGLGEMKPKAFMAAILPTLKSSDFLFDESLEGDLRKRSLVANLCPPTSCFPILKLITVVKGVMAEGDVRAFFLQY